MSGGAESTTQSPDPEATGAGDFMTDQERLTQRRYVELALSGKRRKIPIRWRPKRTKLPSTLPWS